MRSQWREKHHRARKVSVAVTAALAVCASGLAVQAAAAPPRAETVAGPRTPADLDVMFIGAHPDDEAGRLSVYGQWGEEHGVRTGVVTVTRGEGGGNAVGPQEGPALGLIREAEERRAVGRAGITDVYNLDDVDFYYTVSEPLTNQVWSSDTLEKVVRVVRQTRPEILFTMDPAPSPGNHGNHQEAALLALMAYEYAGDPTRFPEQITAEGLEPWSPSKVFGSARGTGVPGPDCATSFTPVRPTQDVYGVWGGARSTVHDATWAQVEREAQREYASQGWGTWGNVGPTIGCDYMAQLAARVPFERGDGSIATADPATALRGALLADPDGLPLGTGLELRTSAFQVVPGESVDVEVVLTAPAETALAGVGARLTAPAGWTIADPALDLGDLAPGQTRTVGTTVTLGATTATTERFLVEVALTDASGADAYTNATVEAVPAVRGTQELLPQVAAFQEWATATGFPEMEGFVTPVLSMPLGGTREVSIDVVNHSGAVQDGGVSVTMPTGFTASPASVPYAGLAPGAATTATFTVTQTDPAMATSMEGGDHPYTITTSSTSGTSTAEGNLEVVPATTVTESAVAPVLDGVVAPGEYTSEIDISRRWEGEECTDAADCSGTAWLTRHGDDLYVAVQVTDDVSGTRLDTADCKRHWRTDSIEIAIDPRGSAENTSHTFKSLILPVTAEGPGCFGRDADNHQGGPEAAPGMEIATSVSDPFTGYVVEARIPASTLPDTVDPAHMGLNVFFYDSDTQDRTGQTRIGWSTWGGVQGDPYRWGIVDFPGWTPPVVAPVAPVIPAVALSSLDSPQAIDQAVRTGVPLSGRPGADPASTATAIKAWSEGTTTTVLLDATGPATAHVFVLDGDDRVIGSDVGNPGTGLVPVIVPATGTPARVLVAAAADAGGTTASAVDVTAPPASATTIALDPSRPVAGEPLAALVGVDGAGLPATGEVTVELDGVAVGTAALVDGVARIDLGSGLAEGEHALRATYPGAGLLPGSSGELAFTVAGTGGGDSPPVPPLDTLTEANKGGVTVPARARAGETITIGMPTGHGGARVDTWLFSDPTWLGSAEVRADDTYRATIPAATPLGAHRLAVYDATGGLVGWGPIEIVADTATPAPAGSNTLPWTGAQVAGAIVGALLLVGAGATTVVWRRRRTG